MEQERELSAPATARMSEMLPGLLGAVRWRRRRRRAAQAAAVVAVVALSALLWSRGGAAAPERPGVPGPAPVAAVCEVVRDVDGVLARYAVRDRVRPEWFVDDDGLAEFLRASERPSGLVRVGDRVTIVRTAIDPFPRTEAE